MPQADKCQMVFDCYLNALDIYLAAGMPEIQLGIDDTPDLERFRRKVEGYVNDGVPEPMADDFRRHVAAFFFHLQYHNVPIQWDSNPRLAAAIQRFVQSEPATTVLPI